MILPTLLIAAQLAQNPSPMVEHTRPHTRLPKQSPRGVRHKLEVGTLYLPPKTDRQRTLLVFFHGGDWLPEVAAYQQHYAALSLPAKIDTARFPALLDAANASAPKPFRRIILGGWSAGCGTIRELMASPAVYRRTRAVLCIDGMHAGYANGQPGPQESTLEQKNLEPWLPLAQDAIAGKKAFFITHSEIFPGTFASTTETADALARQLNLSPHPVLKHGPMGTQQLSEARVGRFRLIGYAGNSAPDHVDQLHSLPQYLKWLR